MRFFALILLLVPTLAAAEPAAIGGAVPTTAGDSGLFRLAGAYVLPERRLSLQLFHDERRHRIGEDVDLDGLTAAVGVTGRLEAFGHVARDRFHEETDAGGGLKWQLRDDRAGDRIALALRAEAGSHGSARVDGIASTWHWAGVAGHAALGFGRRDGVEGVRWGAGLQFQVARVVSVEGEVVGERRLEAGPRNPVDATLGAVLALPGRLFVRGALTQALRPPYGGSFRQGMAVHVSAGVHPGPGPARQVSPPAGVRGADSP